MRRVLLLTALLTGIAGGAIAQIQHQNPPAVETPQNSAVRTDGNTQQTSVPVAGANSFTEGQARSRMEGQGLSNVSDLKKDDSGVWRGSAMKDGKRVDASVDYQGNVTIR